MTNMSKCPEQAAGDSLVNIYICIYANSLRWINKMCWIFYIHRKEDKLYQKKDVKICITKACVTLDKMYVTWKPHLPDNLKWKFFQATAEMVLKYGPTAWTLTKTIEANLDRAYIWMIWGILNITRRQHSTKSQISGFISDISTILHDLW